MFGGRKPERDHSGWETESEYIGKLDRYYQEQNADYGWTPSEPDDKVKELEGEIETLKQRMNYWRDAALAQTVRDYDESRH